MFDHRSEAYGDSLIKQYRRALSIVEALAPCVKYGNVGLEAQYDKILEEIKEVQEAVRIFNHVKSLKAKDNLAMEIVDVMVCCTTMLKQLGYELDDRERIYKKVYKKNDERGYYDANGHN